MRFHRTSLAVLLLLTGCPGYGAILTDFTDASGPVEPDTSSTTASITTLTGSGTTDGGDSSSTAVASSEGGDPGSTAVASSEGGDPGSTAVASSEGGDSQSTGGDTSSGTGDTGDTGDTGPGERCCDVGCPDGDGDGYPDGCDNCPDIANPTPPQELPWDNQMQAVSDYDQDGLGNVCDACPHSADAGAVPGENCCDPRVGGCTKTYAGSPILRSCHPKGAGARFTCETTVCTADYQTTCFGCDGPCMPAGELAPKPGCASNSCKCDGASCVTRWCTVGEDGPCNTGNVCIPWYAPGEAPAGLETAGVCAKAGACAGKTGQTCATWKPK